MVLFNYSTKELTAKIVYYGPGLCGKTTNLQWIHEKLPIKNKGKMLSLATETDRTLFFDFLPIELGTIRGMKTRVQLYTVPGQVFYNATRRMVLKGADCVVFVCDSQEPMLEANVESFDNLRQNLEANEIDPNEVPTVLQYNKRDLPNALPIEIINDRLNPKGLPFYEAVAVKGIGVEETLKGATAVVFRSLAARYGGAAPAPGATPTADRPAGLAAASTASTPTLPRPGAAPPPSVGGAAAVRAAAAAPQPARARPPAAATATLPPRPPVLREDALDPLELQPEPGEPETEEEELSIEVDDDSEVLENTAPSRRLALEDLRPRGAASGQSREGTWPPAAPAPFGTVEEEDVEEISLDAADPEPTPDPPSRSRSPLSEPARAVAELRATPAPPDAPQVIAATVPVSVELRPGSPAHASVSIPVQVMVGGRLTQVQLNLRLVLDLKLQK